MASTSDDPPHQYAETSCFGTLSLTNPLRRACIVVNDSWQFDRFILAFIASNAVVLCLMQPTKLEGRGCASTGSNASTSGAGNAAMEDSELETVDRVPLASTPLGLILDDELDFQTDARVIDVKSRNNQVAITLESRSEESELDAADLRLPPSSDGTPMAT